MVNQEKNALQSSSYIFWGGSELAIEDPVPSIVTRNKHQAEKLKKNELPGKRWVRGEKK